MDTFKYSIIFLLGCITLTIADDFCSNSTKSGSYCSSEVCSFSNELMIYAYCDTINNVSTLLSEVQRLRGVEIHRLYLSDLELPYLPAGLFLGMSVKQLYIEDSVLDNLYSTTDYEPSPFAGLEKSLEELVVFRTKQPSKWYIPDLKGFKNLKNVEIIESPLNFVGHTYAEIGEGSLESLTVINSEVYRIHPQAFPELTNLKEVDFHGNFIPYMVRTMFPNPAKYLTRIDLSNNKLFTLPENMFDNMPVLEIVYLDQNEFKTFQSMPVYRSLTYLTFGNNPFECGCHLLPLKDLLLSEWPISDYEKVKCKLPEDNKEILLLEMSDEVQCN